MFPDAPTERGRKHLEELAYYDRESQTKLQTVKSYVIFVIMNPTARVFMPNIHTDPEFAKLVLQLRDKIHFHAVSIKAENSGNIAIANNNLPIDFESLEKLLLSDTKTLNLGGIYMLNIEIEREINITVGSLGNLKFKKGFYVYVGSAITNLEKRVRRHKRKEKKLRWHIDYLTVRANKITAYPIVTRKKLECPLASAIARIAPDSVPNFGSSDCSCRSHLFYFPENPEKNEEFLGILFRFRHRLAF